MNQEKCALLGRKTAIVFDSRQKNRNCIQFPPQKPQLYSILTTKTAIVFNSHHILTTKGALQWAEELYEVNPTHERVQGYLTYFKSQLLKQVQTRGRRGDAGEENVAM